MTALDEVARTVLERRYLRQDETGAVVETPDELFHRVATNLAQAEAAFGGDPEAVATEFYDAMSNLRFLPNSPTLMNAGTDLQQLAACFVLPLEDSLESIFGTLETTALVHQSGGGTGFSFSAIRPRGDVVKRTGGVASGPVSFMKVYDAATEQIKQGGRRRGANMAVLDADHPDVLEFVTAKREAGALRNFNLSVATTERFWNAYDAGEEFDLVNPRTGDAVETLAPERVLDEIAEMAWATGDPGVLFLDTIQAANPTPGVGDIRSTNPCGETPLLPYEACVLGSVNLAEMTDGDEVDWDRLGDTVRLGIRLLDDAIEMSDFPDERIEERMAGNRKVGLGVMGFHDMLVDLELAYDDAEAVEFADELFEFVASEADAASRRLAAERGAFPNVDESVYDDPIRNATRTAVAPTGTISMIAGCSSSIEPIYSVAYRKHVMDGLEIVDDRFVELARERGFYSEELMDEVRERTSIQDVDAIPDDVKRLFHTAHDVSAERQLELQAAVQRHVDNAVSKTINLPEEASVDDVRDILVRARELDVKGVTVFRSGSKPEQVLDSDPLKEECASECDYVRPDDES